MMTKEEFALRLEEIGAIRFGSFTLKSGITSPFYINLRDVVSDPQMLEAAAEFMMELMPADTDIVSGVPYTALPIASVVSMKSGKGLIFKRKEEKAYGLKDSIVGNYSEGQSCFLIEDLITTGESILENTKALVGAGLRISHIAFLIDRSVDGGAAIKAAGHTISALFTLPELLAILNEKGRISADQLATVNNFLKMQKEKGAATKSVEITNPVTSKILQTIKKKESNLTLSLDVTDSSSFFDILEQCGEHIAVLKTHVDIIDDFDKTFVERLLEAKARHNFIIFEDRKFADIGNTVRHQFRNGVYKIADWADIVTVHPLPGAGILDGLFDGLENKSSFLLARMSSKGNLISEDYTRKAIEMGKSHEKWVSGFIGHGADADDIRRYRNKIPANFLFFMPGVKLGSGGDSLGQSYITPDVAVKNGADSIIVGRGIVAASDPATEAAKYREIAYNEYLKR